MTTITTTELQAEGLPEGATGVEWTDTWSESAAVIEDANYHFLSTAEATSTGRVRFDHGWVCSLANATDSSLVVVDPNGQLVTRAAYDENWG